MVRVEHVTILASLIEFVRIFSKPSIKINYHYGNVLNKSTITSNNCTLPVQLNL